MKESIFQFASRCRGTRSRPNSGGAPVTRLCSLAYADDILLLAHSTSSLQKLFSSLEENGATVGLRINMGRGETGAVCVQ